MERQMVEKGLLGSLRGVRFAADGPPNETKKQITHASMPEGLAIFQSIWCILLISILENMQTQFENIFII